MLPIRWLHLSDLHFGAPGAPVLNQVMSEFWKWLDSAKEVRSAPIDLLLISGDIAYSGKGQLRKSSSDSNSEYDRADEFLARLCEKLANPAVICVPGNHDLNRAAMRDDFLCSAFDHYAQGTGDAKLRAGLEKILWDREANKIRLKPLFQDYLSWSEEKWIKSLGSHPYVTQLHPSYFPGDLFVQLRPVGKFPLVIVGLNSAWLQYNGDNFKDRLTIPLEQFHATLPEGATHNPLDVFMERPRAILMMHHPPEWLGERARKSFYEEIFRSDRFDLCLYGHMHGARAQWKRIDGGRAWIEFQSPSLCGLESYGQANEKRSFGFTVGSISSDGEVRIWPYLYDNRGGQPRFFLDPKFEMVSDEGTVIRDKDRPGCSGGLIPPATDTERTFEGAVLSGVISDVPSTQAATARLVSQMVGTARSAAPTLTTEVLRNIPAGDFTLFVHRKEGQTWSNLLHLALQIALQIAARQPTAMVLHVEHEAIHSGLSGPLMGEEIQYADAMSSQLAKSQIILTSEAYRHLRRLLCDDMVVNELLAGIVKDRAAPNEMDLQIERFMIAPPHRPGSSGSSDDWEIHEAYNLCVWKDRRTLLVGNDCAPAGRIGLGPSSELRQDDLVRDLVRAERVHIVGVTHENLHLSLNRALEVRASLGRAFWKEIKVVFLEPQLLGKVHRREKAELADPARYRRDLWEGSVKNVREFLMSRGGAVSRKWECLQYKYLLPFEAQRFIDTDDRSTIRTISLLANAERDRGYCIETSSGTLLHDQLAAAIDAIIGTGTPIVEFNVYGHVTVQGMFALAGVVSQREWREFRPSNGVRPCYPVSLILLHSCTDGARRVFLQKRTVFNTGGDFDVYSLISGKVNDEDCKEGLLSKEYQDLAFKVTSTGNDRQRQALSSQFATEANLHIGEPVPLHLMENMWRRTVSRELYSELGLDVKPDDPRLKSHPCPHLLPREEFDLYVNLYTLDVSPEDIDYIEDVRPAVSLRSFDRKLLQEFNDNTTRAAQRPPAAEAKGDATEPSVSAEEMEVNQLNHFLHFNFETVIVPLLDELGIDRTC